MTVAPDPLILIDEACYIEASPEVRHVALVMAYRATREGRLVRMTLGELSDMTGIDRPSIRKAQAELERMGWIELIGRFESGPNEWSWRGRP